MLLVIYPFCRICGRLPLFDRPGLPCLRTQALRSLDLAALPRSPVPEQWHQLQLSGGSLCAPQKHAKARLPGLDSGGG